MRKVGTGVLWVITILMLSSVTVFNPGQVTDFFVTLFNIKPSIPELKPIEISERDREISDHCRVHCPRRCAPSHRGPLGDGISSARVRGASAGV